MQVKLLIKENNINFNWKLVQPKIRSIVYVSPVYHKLSYRLKILPVGTPAILPPRRIRIRGRPDLTNLHNAFHTIKIVTSWTSRTLNKQIWVVHSPILPRVSLTQSLAFSAIQKGKGTKKVHTCNCLSKIIFATGTPLMEKLYKNFVFVASVNGVLLQKYWRNTEFNFF